MTDDADDPGVAEEAAVAGWEAPGEGQTWTPIDVSEGATVAEPATSAGRSRRPTAQGLPSDVKRSSDLRATIDASLKTRAPEPLHAAGGGGGGAMAAGAVAGGAGGQPAPAPRIAPHAPDPKPSGPSPLQRFSELARQRPEVAIGVAFAGGILLATILKRLGRR